MSTSMLSANRVYLAHDIAEALKPYCTQIEVAGSIRRGQPEVHDIDIVAESRRLPIKGLFSDNEGEIRDPAFDDAVSNLPMAVEMVRTSGGERMVNFHIPELECDLNLFLVSPPASWGSIMMIRTGPSGFSHLLVTSRLTGGAMPPGMRQEGGCLWQGMARIDTPTEEDYCRALEIPYWDPSVRSEIRLRSWLGRRRA